MAEAPPPREADEAKEQEEPSEGVAVSIFDVAAAAGSVTAGAGGRGGSGGEGGAAGDGRVQALHGRLVGQRRALWEEIETKMVRFVFLRRY